LTDKEQPLLWAVRLAGKATAGAGLTGVVGIYLHAEGTSEHCLVIQEGVQFGKGPLGGVPVRSALFLAGLLAVFPLRSVSNAGQLFQTDQGVWVGLQKALTDAMVGIQLQPSLSLAYRYTATCSRASAFSLEPLLEAGVVIGFRSPFLSAVELRAVVQRG